MKRTRKPIGDGDESSDEEEALEPFHRQKRLCHKLIAYLHLLLEDLNDAAHADLLAQINAAQPAHRLNAADPPPGAGKSLVATVERTGVDHVGSCRCKRGE